MQSGHILNYMNLIGIFKIFKTYKMENYLDRITINPSVCNGKPTIRDMRITVKTILEFLAAGETEENLLKAYPNLQAEDIKAAVQYAARSMDRELLEFKKAS